MWLVGYFLTPSDIYRNHFEAIELVALESLCITTKQYSTLLLATFVNNSTYYTMFFFLQAGRLENGQQDPYSH